MNAKRRVGLASHGGTVTHCKRGHERTPENTDKRGACRTCARELAIARARAKGVRPLHEHSTHCPRGHKRTPENTSPQGACLICKKATDKHRLLARGKRLRVRIARGYEERCPKGHLLTLETVDKSGRCLVCKREHNIATYKPVRGWRLSERCKNGHVRTTQNTRITANGWRACRTCDNASSKARRMKLAPDPLGLTPRNEAIRIRREAQRRAAGIPARNWSAETLAKRSRSRPRGGRAVDTAPFLEWLDGWLATHPSTPLELLTRAAGSAPRSVRSWRRGEVEYVHLEVVDRYLIAADEPAYLLDEMYPLEEAA